MSKYEELGGLLIASQEAYLAIKFQCVDFVRKLRSELAATWNVPDGNCTLLCVDANLEPINRSLISGGFVLDNGFWYCCLSIKYQLPGKNLFMFSDSILGVKKDGNKFVVRIAGKDFDVDPGKPADLASCFDGAYQVFRQSYLDAKEGTQEKKLGFYIRKEDTK